MATNTWNGLRNGEIEIMFSRLLHYFNRRKVVIGSTVKKLRANALMMSAENLKKKLETS